jgi:hypothetical protein
MANQAAKDLIIEYCTSSKLLIHKSMHISNTSTTSFQSNNHDWITQQGAIQHWGYQWTTETLLIFVHIGKSGGGMVVQAQQFAPATQTYIQEAEVACMHASFRNDKHYYCQCQWKILQQHE